MECCPEVRSPAQCNVAHVTRVFSVIKYACSNHSWMQCASSMATITARCWNKFFEKSSLHGGLTAVSGDMNTVSINNNYSRYSAGTAVVQQERCIPKRKFPAATKSRESLSTSETRIAGTPTCANFRTFK